MRDYPEMLLLLHHEADMHKPDNTLESAIALYGTVFRTIPYVPTVAAGLPSDPAKPRAKPQFR